jgi:hypothetical protein
MGLSGISKSQVSKLCKEIDERVHAFLDRPLDLLPRNERRNPIAATARRNGDRPPLTQRESLG